MAIIYNNSLHPYREKNSSILPVELVIPSIIIPEEDGVLLKTAIREHRIWLSAYLNRSEI